MILTEYLNDNTLIKHYSDKGYLLLLIETGAKYAEPIDVIPCRYSYVETDEFIDGNGNGNEEISGDEFKEMVENEVL